MAHTCCAEPLDAIADHSPTGKGVMEDEGVMEGLGEAAKEGTTAAMKANKASRGANPRPARQNRNFTLITMPVVDSAAHGSRVLACEAKAMKLIRGWGSGGAGAADWRGWPAQQP